MDTHVSAPQAARALGVSLPRVHRLLDNLGVARTGRGVPRPVTVEALQALVDRIGAVPTRVEDLDRVQMLVLAALARAGLGLESVRAVARVAGTSPSATATALSVLEAKGLAARQVRRVVQGVPRTVTFWSANVLGDAWTERIASATARVILPADLTTPVPTPRARRIPARFAHLFWNVQFSEVDTTRDADYVASRMLGADDVAAWLWAVDHLPESSLRRAGQIRGIPPGSTRFVDNRMARRSAQPRKAS